MTKKDLIRLCIKAFGIFLLMSMITTFISQIAMFGFATNGDSWEVIVWAIFAITIGVSFCLWLILAPDSIISMFKLDKGFDDDDVKLNNIQFNTLPGFIVLFIGGLFILSGFATLVTEIGFKIHDAFSSDSSFFPMMEMSNNTRLYSNIIEVVVGLYLIFNYRKIGDFLINKNIES